MPERLYAKLVTVSEQDQRTVSDWIVVTIDQAVREAEARGRADSKETWKRYKPKDTDKRLTVRMSMTLAESVKRIAGSDAKSISLWISHMVEHVIEARGAQNPPPS